MAALRAEAAAAERRLEEERGAHAEARRSFVAREAELEAGLADSAAALTAMQRSLDDRTRRCTQAEQRALSAEQRADALAQDLALQSARCLARKAYISPYAFSLIHSEWVLALPAGSVSVESPATAKNGFCAFLTWKKLNVPVCWCRMESAGSQALPGTQQDAGEVDALRRTIGEQGAALQEAAAQRQAAEDWARRLQQDVDRLSSELHEAGPASDLQRQFREVTAPRSSLLFVLVLAHVTRFGGWYLMPLVHDIF